MQPEAHPLPEWPTYRTMGGTCTVSSERNRRTGDPDDRVDTHPARGENVQTWSCPSLPQARSVQSQPPDLADDLGTTAPSATLARRRS